MLLSVNGPVVNQLGGKSMDLQFGQLDGHINPSRDVRSGARPLMRHAGRLGKKWLIEPRRRRRSSSFRGASVPFSFPNNGLGHAQY